MKSQKITLRNAGIPGNSGDADGLLVRSKHFNDMHDDLEAQEATDMRLLELTNQMEGTNVTKELAFNRELTDAEVASMFTAGTVPLVPAPGPGKVIQMVCYPIFIVKFGTAAWTGGGTTTLRVGTTVITAVLSTANNLLATADRASFIALLDTANGITLPINEPLFIQNITAAFVKGTSTSKLTVKFKYRIHTI